MLDRGGALWHLECPLRVQLEPGARSSRPRSWLPLAARSRLAAAARPARGALALAAIGADGAPRGVNLALASLADGAFTTQLRQLLVESPRARAAC